LLSSEPFTYFFVVLAMSLAERLTGAGPNGNGGARARVRARLVEELGPKLADDSVADHVLQDVIRRRLG
jgi:hypothetical protein